MKQIILTFAMLVAMLIGIFTYQWAIGYIVETTCTVVDNNIVCKIF